MRDHTLEIFVEMNVSEVALISIATANGLTMLIIILSIIVMMHWSWRRVFRSSAAGSWKLRKTPLMRVSISFDYTISSFADYYFQRSGCYEGCCSLQGNARAFVQESIRGGKCQANDKFVRQVVQGPVSDYDAVSLYPSSMWRLGQDLGGMPMGMARMIPTPINWPLDYQYYVVRIRILAITKWQQMPMVSLKIKGKVKYFNRGDIVSHLNFVVGRITLED